MEKFCPHCAQPHDATDCPWLEDVQAYERDAGQPCDNQSPEPTESRDGVEL